MSLDRGPQEKKKGSFVKFALSVQKLWPFKGTENRRFLERNLTIFLVFDGKTAKSGGHVIKKVKFDNFPSLHPFYLKFSGYVP